MLTTAAVSGLGAAPGAEPASQTLGKDAFMQLLVTQLRHQNPLEPMDNKDFIAQLSQFTSLEELSSIRESFDASLATQRTMNQTMAVGLLGREVGVPANQVTLESGLEAKVHYTLPEQADVQIEIQNVLGTVVRTLTPGAQPSGDQGVVWDGNDDLGNPLPEGNYTYHVLAVGGGNRQVPVQPFFKGLVDSVRMTDAGIMLTVEGREVPLSQISVIQAAEARDDDDEK
jgi:flagellar basal-body rod modification protein FlgD